MGGNNEQRGAWYEEIPEVSAQPHPVPESPAPATTEAGEVGDGEPRFRLRRRTWGYVGAIAAVVVVAAGIGQQEELNAEREERQHRVDAYKGRSGASLDVDSVEADVVARWTRSGDAVIVALTPYGDVDAKYLRLEGGRETSQSQGEKGWYAKSVEIKVPVEDPYADVIVRVAIGGKSWKEGSRATSQTIRLSPTGDAYDGKTGAKLPSDL